MMIEALIERKSGLREHVTALNDIVITHGFNYNINDFTVLADGALVSSLRADGLIFYTPTGASAYSLSAGGPLIEPTLDCIEFTQICPHSLFARTMLFSSEKLIEIKYKAVSEIISYVNNLDSLLDFNNNKAEDCADWKEYYEVFNNKLHEAGIDAVVDEMNQQIN